MSNRRVILFLLFACAALALLLWGSAFRSREVATVRTRATFSSFDPDEVTALEISTPGTGACLRVRLERSVQGWQIAAPFAAAADEAACAALLDALTLSPVADMLSFGDLRRLDHTLADFGLAPARLAVSLFAATRQERLLLGAATPSGREIYARSEALRNVFTIPATVYARCALPVDALRSSRLVTMRRDDVTGFECRLPDSPYVKLSRSEGAWYLQRPTPVLADAHTVEAIVDRLVAARAVRFVWPSADLSRPSSEKPRADLLASYGVDPASPNAFVATLRRGHDVAEQIVFGRPAGTNLVYALVQHGSAIVAVDAELAAFCRVGEARLRDTRLFPCEAVDVRSLTVTTDEGIVYRLMQDAERAWRFDMPVRAPADPAAVAGFIAQILALRQTDLADAGLGIAVETSATNLPSRIVHSDTYAAGLENLRAKTLLALPAGSVRRIVRRTAAQATAVVWDADRNAWSLSSTADEGEFKKTQGVVNDGALAGLIAALAHVEAVGVERLSAAPSDFERCGLDKPFFTLALDLSHEAHAHREIVLGGAAPGGGRYAMVGGADAIFILSRKTVAALTVSFVE